MEETKRNLKSNLKRKVRITQALLTAFLITGIVSYSTEEKNINITITNVGEQTGLELGTNSRARGVGSISTGKNSLAIGKNAVATGGDETKETIYRKLEENKQKLADIENAQAELNRKTNELAAKQARERATIEAGIRVEEIKKAKEKAKLKWEESLSIYNTEKNNSSDFFKKHQAKIDDLNSRLAGLSQIQGVDISSDEGLTKAATQLKTLAENGTNLNLTLDFYKDYVTSYYKALGELTRNNKMINLYETGSYNNSNPTNIELDANNVKAPFKYLTFLGTIDRGSTFNNDPKSQIFGFDFYSMNEFNSFISNNSLTYLQKQGINFSNLPTKNIKILKLDTESISLEKYQEVKEEIPKFKQTIREYFEVNNDIFLTNEIKNVMYKLWDLKLDHQEKIYEVGYYQNKYEETRDTTWLDKKKKAIDEANQIEKEFKNQPSIYNLRTEYKNKWVKENITDIVEKNKITVETLTNELEQALGINKEAVLNKEKELEALKNKADQDKKNYEGLNPSEADMVLAREYERVKAEINALSDEIVQADERLRALKEALTLHDLTNVGENQIAQGTNALAAGNNSIAVGKSSSSIGLDSIAIGTNATTTGEKSISIGTDTVTVGNKNVNIGYGNILKGNNVFILGSNVDASTVENAVVLGNNSEAVTGTVSVGAVGSERKIINVADGEISKDSKEAINGSQLKNYVDTSMTLGLGLLNTEAEKEKIGKLTFEGKEVNFNSLPQPGGGISNYYYVYDENSTNVNKERVLTTEELEKVKVSLNSPGTGRNMILNNIANGENINDAVNVGQLNTKLDKSEFTAEKISEKLSKGEITSTDLTVTGTGKILDANIGLSIKNGVITKDKLSESLKTEIDNKASITDLANKANVNATNIDVDKYTEKLSESSNLDNPANKLITDTKVKDYLSNNYYTNTEIDKKISNVNVKTEADVISTTLDIKNGENRIIGTENISIELKNNSISKDKLDNTLKSEIDNKVNINGNNIVNRQDKADFRNNIEVYSKDEIENKLNSITINGADLTGEITATEEKGVKGKVIHNHLVNNYVNKSEIQMRDEMIINNYNEIQRNKIAIEVAEKKINKTAALSTAMASIEYPKIGVGEVAVGAGISGFGGEQGVAVGVGYMPSENLLLGLKYAALMDNRFNGAVSGSVGYKFRLHN